MKRIEFTIPRFTIGDAARICYGVGTAQDLGAPVHPCGCGARYTPGLRSRDNSQIVVNGRYVCASCWNDALRLAQNKCETCDYGDLSGMCSCAEIQDARELVRAVAPDLLTSRIESIRPPALSFYLKCGMHWIHVTPGHGCFWETCADPEHATRYETREEAEEWKRRLEAVPYAPQYEIVNVP